MGARAADIRNHANLIWGIAELLRGDYKRAEYGKVILPLVVMRRLDQVLEERRDLVIARAAELEQKGVENPERALRQVAGHKFFNRHRLRFHQLLDDPGNIAQHLRSYIDGYSELAREVVDKFEFDRQIDRLDRSNLLFQVIARICAVDLHPERVPNHEMGAIFEELIRKFAEQSNETAGEHFTPRDVVRLMVNLLLAGDEEALRTPGVRRDVFDCACGTGGMLSEADERIRGYNKSADVHLFGQELNPESYAICLADMLVKDQDASYIAFGNSLSVDGHAGQRFDYCIANPPFGVDWSKVQSEVRDEHERLGFDGRFGPGLPRKSDGQVLFLMHLISKMRDPDKRGSRIAIVHNGSPLFTGAAGSGESEIRRWIIEQDWLEAIVALPEQLFYNTGIASYVWVLTNHKSEERRGKVQLIDARKQWVKMRKSLGAKRRELSPEQIEEVTRLHGAFAEGELVKILPNESFGYRTITVERPLRASWSVSAKTWEAVEDDKALAKLAEDERASAGAALRAMPARRWETAAECAAELKAALSDAGLKPSAPVVKSLTARCLARDPDLPERRDSKDRIEWDPDLRDTENVPLSEDVDDYLPRARGTAARPGCTRGRSRRPNRLRDPVHAAVLQVHAAATERGDQGGAAGAGEADTRVAGGGAGVRMRLRRTTAAVLGGVWGDEPSGTPDDVAVIRVADFDYGGLRVAQAPTQRAVPRSTRAPRLLEFGDLLLEKSGGGERQNVGRVVRFGGPVPAVFSNFITLLRPSPGFDSRFLTYLHRSLYRRGVAAAATKQTTGIQNLDVGAYLSSSVDIPSLERQRSAADFMDFECDRIRAMQEELEAVDRTRKEANQALLADEVGVGRWPPAQIRHVAMTGTGHTPSREHPEYWRSEERTIPWFTLADVWQIRDDARVTVTETSERITPRGVANSSAEVHPRGTVLLSRTASVGFSAVMGCDMAVSQDFMTWTCGPQLDPHFLLFALRATRPELRRLMTGSTHQTIYMPDLHALRIPLPAMEEQRRAVRALETEFARYWTARAELRALSELLEEYRDALITEAVTGKLDLTRLSDQQLDESAHAAMEGERPEVLST